MSQLGQIFSRLGEMFSGAGGVMAGGKTSGPVNYDLARQLASSSIGFAGASPSAPTELAAVIARTLVGENFPRPRRQVADPDDRNEDVQRWALRFCRLVPFPDIQYPLSE